MTEANRSVATFGLQHSEIVRVFLINDFISSFEADAITFKGGDGRLMKSGLALADYAGWRMKARVTYPESIADEFERFLTVVMLNEYDNISARQKQLDAIATDTSDDL